LKHFKKPAEESFFSIFVVVHIAPSLLAVLSRRKVKVHLPQFFRKSFMEFFGEREQKSARDLGLPYQ
jgi:hypothetical protein